MTPELRDRWIAALESGEYEKGAGDLCSQGAYCCLGVLAAINGDLEIRRGRGYVDGTGLYLPDGYCGLALRRDADGETRSDDDEQLVLSKLNDESATFAPVIDKIRELFPDGAS